MGQEGRGYGTVGVWGLCVKYVAAETSQLQCENQQQSQSTHASHLLINPYYVN